MKPLAQYQELAVTKFFGLLPAGSRRILEIGSDVEYVVVDNIAARFSGTVTGINPTPGFVKRSPQDGPPNVTILEADGCDMPFDDRSFDAILSVATMEHVLDLPKFLEESHRVLKPGGVFYTNFSPIWSSGIGHHVCAFAGRKEARFWKPDRNPLPDFSHLLWDEDEMREYLLDSPYDDRLIDPIIDWVYRSGNISRCFYEDYLEAFRASPLEITAFAPGVYKSPSPELLEALRAKHGRHRDFSHHSIEAVLSRPAISNSLPVGQPATAGIKADEHVSGTGTGTDMPNVVLNFHRGDQASAERLLNLLLAVDEGIACTYHLQYGDPPDTLTIMDAIERFGAEKEVVLHFDLPHITVPAELVANDPNLAEYPGNQARRTGKQKHAILQWNLCVYKFINLLDSFLMLEPDCVILKNGWLADIHAAYRSSDLPIFGHLKSGMINGSPMPTHWAGCSVYNGSKLRGLDLERYFSERYENPWWRFRNLPGTTNANNCFYGPAFSGYDVSYDYFLFARYWLATTGSSDPFHWPLQEIENRDDLIYCDFHSTLTAEEIYDRFRDRLPVLHGVKSDDSRLMMTAYFSGGGPSTMTMTRTTPHTTGTGTATDSASRATTPQLPQRRLSPEELFVMTNRRMGQFRNRHKGQRCVIIGNGPSLNKMDLSFLENEITFGMNRIFLMYDTWNFRPTYYVSVNPLVIEQSAEEILKIDAPKFLSHKGIPFFDDPGDIHFLQSIPQWFFSKDPRNGICEGWTVTYVAMQLAWFMGFDEVVLIGVDHHFVTQGDPNKEVVSEGDDPNHFHPGYFGKGTRWHLPDLERSEGSYLMAKQAFESENRRIIDATVDGKLTIFPKADYRELFKTASRPGTDIPAVPGEQRMDESARGEASCRISVITPSFNQGGYIEQTIQSVLGQDYPDVEHIVIDGGSTDATIDVLTRYPHLDWVSERDNGQADALNKGFGKATGDIIAWINSDDWYEPNAFRQVAAYFTEHPDRDIVMGNCNLVDERGIIFDTVVNHERGFDDLRRHWIARSIPTQPALFFRRRLLDECGMLDETLHFAMDYDLWMRFARNHRFFHLDSTVANYRFHGSAKGGDQDWSKFLPDCNSVFNRYCTPAVSVVIPCYNYARYLANAVESVLVQTLQNFEIIIVNDGSTDNSREVAEQLIAAYPDGRIRLINQANSGDPALARNRGIQEAHGEFILCLDADDLIMPEFLHRCVTLLSTEQDIAIAYTDQIYFNSGNDRVVRVADYDFNRLTEANFMGYCSLFRKSAWDAVGGFTAGIGYEDWEFWISCGEHGHYARRIPEPLFCYRQHTGGRYELDQGRDALIKARIALRHPALHTTDTLRRAEQTVADHAGTGGEDRPFRVIALISAHNEGDVISHVIGALAADGVEVYLINHCSTDNTVEEASNWLGKGLLHIENFPQDAGYPVENEDQYIWHHILRRKEELATQLDADWFIHTDADEFRESPWPGLTLHEGIQVADRMGHNALDFELLNFRPTDNSFVPGTDVRNALTFYEPAENFNTYQVKAWKNLGIPVSIFRNGGHNISFEGRSVCPVKFILRHYPVRSQSHGLKKVFAERKQRFNADEQKAGWHIQYASITDERHNFIRSPDELTAYDGGAVRLSLLSADALAIAATLPGRQTDQVTSPSPDMHAGVTAAHPAPPADAGTEVDRLIEKAKTLANEGAFDKAAQTYRQVISTAPHNGRALVGLGVIHLLQGNFIESSARFADALEADPGDAGALCGLGMVRSAQGYSDEGFALYRKALDLDPENLTALHELLKAGYRFDRLGEAEPYVQGYLMYHPGDGHMLFSLAGLQYRTGKLDDAYDNLERLLIFEPSYEGGTELSREVSRALAERDGSVLLAAGS